MSQNQPDNIQLAHMKALGELFALFHSGKHLNRIAEPVLWHELEQHEAAYRALFSALGYPLEMDARGFAWFAHQDASSNMNKISRQLALLFMLIFDAKANAGKPLQGFTDWRLDTPWLHELHQQHEDMLTAEGLDASSLLALMQRAQGLGFAQNEAMGWRLLPAVQRYLDHFQALVASDTAALVSEDEADDEAVDAAQDSFDDDDEDAG